MSKKGGWAWDQKIHLPRTQQRTTGKQEGTQPKKLNGKRHRVTNLNDQMRRWRDIADGEGLPAVRQALREILAQFQHHLDNPAPTPTPEHPELDPDIVREDYREVCKKLDALEETLGEWQKAKKKTIAVSVLREILEDKA